MKKDIVLKTENDSVRMWSQVGLLKEIPSEDHKKLTAVCLENQRLFNEIEGPNKSLRFLRLSIPIVRRVFGKDAPFFDWVSVQPAISPSAFIYIERSGQYKTISRPCITRMFKERWIDDSADVSVSLDQEIEFTALFSAALTDEISREIIKDIRVIAPKHEARLDVSRRADSFKAILNESADKILSHLGKYPSWIIASSKIVAEITKSISGNFVPSEKISPCSVKLAGHIGNTAVYEEPMMEDNVCLMGCKVGWNEAGYYYAPYILLATSKMKTGGDVVLGRYAKHAEPDAKYYYLTVKIEGLDSEIAETIPMPETVSDDILDVEVADGGLLWEDEVDEAQEPQTLIVLQKTPAEPSVANENIEIEEEDEVHCHSQEADEPLA